MTALQQGKNRIFLSCGSSMLPLIPHHSRLIIDKKKNPELGDVVIFRRKKNRVFAHRIVLIKKKYFLTMGDNVMIPERVKKQEILGTVTHIILPNGSTVLLSSFYQRMHSLLFSIRSIFRIALLKIRIHCQNYSRS
jgi:hypothetical protein